MLEFILCHKVILNTLFRDVVGITYVMYLDFIFVIIAQIH